MRFLIDCGSRLIPGLFETERCFYGALNSEIKKILQEHKADPNKFDHLGQNLQGLRSLSLHSDFRIILESISEKGVNTKIFDLHRFVLSVRSPWFAERFETDWKEQKEVVIQVEPNTIFPSIAVASATLDFLYTAKIDIDEDDAPALAEVLTKLEYFGVASQLKTEIQNEERELMSIVLKLEKERNRLARDLGSAFHSFSAENNSISTELLQVNMRSWSDICLQVKNGDETSECYVAHRALLALHSSYFHAMINGQFRESVLLKSSGTGIPVLTLDEFDRADLLRVAIRFLYTNRLHDELSVEDSIELLELSDKLLLMELKRLCAVRLRKHIQSSNVFDFLRLGDRFSIRLLRQACLDFIEQNIQELYLTEEFELALKEFSEEIVQELRLYITDKIEDAPAAM